ncbi:MAG TPA: diacylglycerol kinase family protein [Bacteroidales bacterium]|nr:diacylglycerol kinase family protein [Bacteroidales bacterium]
MKQNRFLVAERLKSFKHAFNGLRILFKEEHNAQIHFFAAVSAILAGFLFDISVYEWLAIVFAIGFVITMEIANTAIEGISDFVSPKKNDKIKRIKDLSAAGVLVSAITALIIGLIIFVPKFLSRF